MLERIKDKNVLILGMGERTTLPLVSALKELGAMITINDGKRREELTSQIKALSSMEYRLFAGDHNISLKDIDLIIVNPAVPPRNPLLQKAKERGIPFFGELELAYQLLKSPIIAITGTNGKTTTTHLLGEILKKGERRVEVGGNIGRALIGLIHDVKEEDLVVAEVSSFQLATTVDFTPQLGIILNISPDHLDYHGSLREYQKAKKRIFLNQGPCDSALLNGDDPLLLSWSEELKGRTYLFRLQGEVSQGAYIKNKRVILRLEKEEEVLSLKDLTTWGYYNCENLLPVIIAASLYGIEREVIGQVVSSFHGLEHRQEEVATIDGVTYYNNSKATNPHATLKDLDLFNPPLILIIGGQRRCVDLTPLFQPIIEKVSFVLLLGETADELEEGLRKRDYKQYRRVHDLEEAVLLASLYGEDGTKVILSPAAPSWDMFQSYEERGRIFKEIVNRHKGED